MKEMIAYRDFSRGVPFAGALEQANDWLSKQPEAFELLNVETLSSDSYAHGGVRIWYLESA